MRSTETPKIARSNFRTIKFFDAIKKGFVVHRRFARHDVVGWFVST
jgi:hypothetical protein